MIQFRNCKRDPKYLGICRGILLGMQEQWRCMGSRAVAGKTCGQVDLAQLLILLTFLSVVAFIVTYNKKKKTQAIDFNPFLSRLFLDFFLFRYGNFCLFSSSRFAVPFLFRWQIWRWRSSPLPFLVGGDNCRYWGLSCGERWRNKKAEGDDDVTILFNSFTHI